MKFVVISVLFALGTFSGARSAYAADLIIAPNGQITVQGNAFSSPQEAAVALIEFLRSSETINAMNDRSGQSLIRLVNQITDIEAEGVSPETLQELVKALGNFQRSSSGMMRRIESETSIVLSRSIDKLYRVGIKRANTEQGYIDAIIERSRYIDYVGVGHSNLYADQTIDILLDFDRVSHWEKRFNKSPIDLIVRVLTDERSTDRRIVKRFMEELVPILASSATSVDTSQLEQDYARLKEPLATIIRDMNSLPGDFFRNPYAVNVDRSQRTKEVERKALTRARRAAKTLSRQNTFLSLVPWLRAWKPCTAQN